MAPTPLSTLPAGDTVTRHDATPEPALDRERLARVLASQRDSSPRADSAADKDRP